MKCKYRVNLTKWFDQRLHEIENRNYLCFDWCCRRWWFCFHKSIEFPKKKMVIRKWEDWRTTPKEKTRRWHVASNLFYKKKKKENQSKRKKAKKNFKKAKFFCRDLFRLVTTLMELVLFGTLSRAQWTSWGAAQSGFERSTWNFFFFFWRIKIRNFLHVLFSSCYFPEANSSIQNSSFTCFKCRDSYKRYLKLSFLF